MREYREHNLSKKKDGNIYASDLVMDRNLFDKDNISQEQVVASA